MIIITFFTLTYFSEFIFKFFVRPVRMGKCFISRPHRLETLYQHDDCYPFFLSVDWHLC